MWPKLLDMSKDECKRLLRRTELEAYAGIISAFRAQGDLTKDKKLLLNDLSTTLSISTERHRAEVRRAVNDEKLSTVAERLSGPHSSSEWAIEGRRLIPLMPRLVPQTVFSLTANQAANAAFSHNLTLPMPSETARKEGPIGNENSGVGLKSQPQSPSSNVVVLPSGISIPVKGALDINIEAPLVKRSRYDSSSSSLSKESLSSSHGPSPASSPSVLPPPLITKPSSGHIITTSRSLSLPAASKQQQQQQQQHMGFNASKQHGGLGLAGNKSLIGLSMASSGKTSMPGGSSSSGAKAGLSGAQSPVKYTYTKASTGHTGVANSAQKVILVSSSSTSFTPSILQRSHSVPSSRSPIVKSGAKQSVILTSMSGQSLSRPPDMMSSVKQGGTQSTVTPRGRQQNAVSVNKSNIRQAASLSRQQAEATACQIASSRQFTNPDAMPGVVPAVSTGRRLSGNAGTLPSIKSTVITARTTTSLITSQMASYMSTNLAGKPRGRAVSKQKLMRQVVQHPDMTQAMGSGLTPASKKQQHVKQETGMKVVSPSLGVSVATKQHRSMSQPAVTMETSPKPSLLSPAMSTPMPVTTIAGNKVIIGTSSAGVISHHMPTTTPVSRAKHSAITSSMGSAKPKTVQTIKATTTANVCQTMTSVTQKLSGKPSIVMMHKAFPPSPQAQISESAKQLPAHNIMTSSHLQRPRISMVTGVTSTTTASSMAAASIRFPTLQSTGNVTMTTTVKSPGPKRMRSPITMGTGINQKRSVASISPNALQSSKSPGTSEEVPTSKPEFQGSMKRGLLTSCTHPNSEWIDYDGSPPDSSASSAIKALLEFRSHPDRQTIDLSHMGSLSASSSTRTAFPPPQAAAQSSSLTARLTQSAPVMPKASQYDPSHGVLPQPMEGVSQLTLLSNMQSKLKRALTTEKPGKTIPSATFLQTATMEVEKALQEQNKALLAKHSEVGSSQPGERTSSPTGLPDFTVHKKVQPERSSGDGGQGGTVEEQDVVADRVNVPSEDVSTFVDQFEQFLESEGLEDVLEGVVSGGQNPSDRPEPQRSSESADPPQAAESFQVVAGKISVEKPDGGSWSDKSGIQRVVAELVGPSWGSQASVEPVASSVQKVAASVVMESGSVDISQMKIEDFTSQRLQDEEEEEDAEKQLTSPESSPVKTPDGGYMVSPGSGSDERGSSESMSVRISSRKRKAPPPIDDEPGPTSMSSWARAAFNLLQRVMRFRGANRSKGDLNAASWFTRPVAAAEAPGYNKVIKNPMDFGTVKRKLESSQYGDYSSFHYDMMLVHDNCVQYNPAGHEIRRDCEEVFQFYTTECNKLTERRERPSPKKSKAEDLHGEKGKTPAVRSLSLTK